MKAYYLDPPADLRTLDLDEVLQLKAVEQAALDLIREVESGNSKEVIKLEYENLKELINYNGSS